LNWLKQMMRRKRRRSGPYFTFGDSRQKCSCGGKRTKKTFICICCVVNILLLIFAIFAARRKLSAPRRMSHLEKFATVFYEKEKDIFLDAAKNFELDPRFDLEDDFRNLGGDEDVAKPWQLSWSKLQAIQKETIYERGGVDVFTDKILFKELVRSVGIPTQPWLYAAHESDYSPEKLLNAIDGQTDYIVKPSHLSWSDYQIISRKDKPVTDFALLLQTVSYSMKKNASLGDVHYHNLEPGVIVEKLFETDVDWVRPVEAKVLCFWGRVFLMTVLQPGTILYIWRDGEYLNDVNAFMDWIEPLLPEVIETSELICSLGQDNFRVDFFLSPGKWILNECEISTGTPSYEENKAFFSQIWYDGYFLGKPKRRHYKNFTDTLIHRHAAL